MDTAEMISYLPAAYVVSFVMGLVLRAFVEFRAWLVRNMP
jgi:hypothetical protein